jgi:hypothetical protein
MGYLACSSAHRRSRGAGLMACAAGVETSTTVSSLLTPYGVLGGSFFLLLLDACGDFWRPALGSYGLASTTCGALPRRRLWHPAHALDLLDDLYDVLNGLFSGLSLYRPFGQPSIPLDASFRCGGWADLGSSRHN